MYDTYATDNFKKIFNSLDKSEQDWIEKIKRSFKIYSAGKPLGYKWFREKKYKNKRLYFLVDEEREKVLFLSFASKKNQQEIINFVIANRRELLNYLKSL
jgi:hypothetical protein